jgi:plastocyanin
MTTSLVLPAILALALVGCGSSPKSESAANEAPAAAPVPAVDPAIAATIEGTVLFEGTPPADTPIDMKADPTCGLHHSGQVVMTERAVVKDGKVRWAFVRVTAGLEGGPFGVPAERVKIDQVGCRYEPHMVGAVVGQTVEIFNSDETLHNVHAVCKANRAFNFGMPLKGMKQERKFTAAEIVHLKCDVHPWMSSWVGVSEHPFFAVSDAEGRFAIRGLPPGTYTLEAWHETFGTRTAEVVVGPADTTSTTFLFKEAS